MISNVAKQGQFLLNGLKEFYSTFLQIHNSRLFLLLFVHWRRKFKLKYEIEIISWNDTQFLLYWMILQQNYCLNMIQNVASKWNIWSTILFQFIDFILYHCQCYNLSHLITTENSQINKLVHSTCEFPTKV